MDKSKKKKKRPARLMDSLFYRVYFAALSIALVCIAIGMIWLSGVVRRYEAAQPVHAAEVVAQLFESGDYDTIYAFDTSAQQISGGDKAFYVDSLATLAQGKSIAWREAFSTEADQKSYSVTLDGDKFATFTLERSDAAGGGAQWQLASVTTHIALQEPVAAQAAAYAPCRITAPEGSAVTVDGRALTEADVISTEPLLPEGFLPEGCASPTMVVYGFDATGAQPAISVVDQAGAQLEIESTGESTWLSRPAQDEALSTAYADAIIKLATRVAKYTAKDLSQSALLSGVASGSPAETVIKKFSNSWAPSHKSSQVKDPVVSELYVIAEDCFTCHVKFDFVLTSYKGNDYVYPTEYTFCVVKRRGEGRLYNLTFH